MGSPVHKAQTLDSLTISHQVVMADRHEDKMAIPMNISFPPPAPYEGDKGQEGPTGTAYQIVDEHFPGHKQQGEPRADGIDPLAIQCICGGARQRSPWSGATFASVHTPTSGRRQGW